MHDLDVRPWWVFRLPGSIVHVPGETEAKARTTLAAHCYPGAPVDAWSLISTRVTSRQALTASLLLLPSSQSCRFVAEGQ